MKVPKPRSSRIRLPWRPRGIARYHSGLFRSNFRTGRPRPPRPESVYDGPWKSPRTRHRRSRSCRLSLIGIGSALMLHGPRHDTSWLSAASKRIVDLPCTTNDQASRIMLGDLGRELGAAGLCRRLAGRQHQDCWPWVTHRIARMLSSHSVFPRTLTSLPQRTQRTLS